jgi:hypothetical protein
MFCSCLYAFLLFHVIFLMLLLNTIAVSAFFLHLFKYVMIAAKQLWCAHSETNTVCLISSHLSNINYRGHVLFLSLCIPFNPPNIFNAWPFKQLLYQRILSLLVLACNDRCLTTLICTLWKQLSSLNFKADEAT